VNDEIAAIHGAEGMTHAEPFQPIVDPRFATNTGRIHQQTGLALQFEGSESNVRATAPAANTVHEMEFNDTPNPASMLYSVIAYPLSGSNRVFCDKGQEGQE